MEVSGENFLKFVLLNCRQNLHGTHILVSFTNTITRTSFNGLLVRFDKTRVFS